MTEPTTAPTEAQPLAAFIAELMGWEVGVTISLNRAIPVWTRDGLDYLHTPPPYDTDYAYLGELIGWLNERGYKIAHVHQIEPSPKQYNWRVALGEHDRFQYGDTLPEALCKVVRALVERYPELREPMNKETELCER